MNDWKEQARAHWREFRPKLFRDLKKAGELESALDDAVARTSLEMAELQAMGYKDYEAWEIVRESYLFVPEEGKTPAQDSPFWRPSANLRASDYLHDGVKRTDRELQLPNGSIELIEQLKKAPEGE